MLLLKYSHVPTSSVMTVPLNYHPLELKGTKSIHFVVLYSVKSENIYSAWFSQHTFTLWKLWMFPPCALSVFTSLGSTNIPTLFPPRTYTQSYCCWVSLAPSQVLGFLPQFQISTWRKDYNKSFNKVLEKPELYLVTNSVVLHLGTPSLF